MFWALFLIANLQEPTALEPQSLEIEQARSTQLEEQIKKLKSENKTLKSQVKKLSKLIKGATCTINESSPKTESSAENLLPTLKMKADSFPAPRSPNEEKQLYEKALKTIETENWDEALLRMEHFIKYFPQSSMADNAIFWMAQIYLQKNEPELARAELIRLDQLYPESERTQQAKLILKDLPTKRGEEP